MSQEGAPKRRLGRGLDALLGGKSHQAPEAEPVAAAPPQPAEDTATRPATLLPVGQIRRNPFQPRSEFDEDSLNELAKSIGLHGVLSCHMGCVHIVEKSVIFCNKCDKEIGTTDTLIFPYIVQ